LTKKIIQKLNNKNYTQMLIWSSLGEFIYLPLKPPKGVSILVIKVIKIEIEFDQQKFKDFQQINYVLDLQGRYVLVVQRPNLEFFCIYFI